MTWPRVWFEMAHDEPQRHDDEPLQRHDVETTPRSTAAYYKAFSSTRSTKPGESADTKWEEEESSYQRINGTSSVHFQVTLRLLSGSTVHAKQFVASQM